jgi:hypothetical protein
MLYDEALLELSRSNLSISLGPVTSQVMLKSGGNGYFRTRVIHRYVEQRILALTSNSPQFSYLVCYPQKNSDKSNLKQQLIKIFGENDDWF